MSLGSFDEVWDLPSGCVDPDEDPVATPLVRLRRRPGGDRRMFVRSRVPLDAPVYRCGLTVSGV
ncbi:hypothetical protein [Actinophytocola sp.]|uniref:hypothetical protein n=1 Tax=Actinophytocola sp. TaxID=1872138 RepID=UPI003D6C5829